MAPGRDSWRYMPALIDPNVRVLPRRVDWYRVVGVAVCCVSAAGSIVLLLSIYFLLRA